MATLKLTKTTERVKQLRRGKNLTGQEQDQKVWDWLRRDYPDLFTTREPLPLKIGINNDLLEQLPDGCSKKALRRVLAKWTKRYDYYRAVAAGGPRFGLNGIDGEVAADQLVEAAKNLDRFKNCIRG